MTKKNDVNIVELKKGNVDAENPHNELNDDAYDPIDIGISGPVPGMGIRLNHERGYDEEQEKENEYQKLIRWEKEIYENKTCKNRCKILGHNLLELFFAFESCFVMIFCGLIGCIVQFSVNVVYVDIEMALISGFAAVIITAVIVSLLLESIKYCTSYVLKDDAGTRIRNIYSPAWFAAYCMLIIIAGCAIGMLVKIDQVCVKDLKSPCDPFHFLKNLNPASWT